MTELASMRKDIMTKKTNVTSELNTYILKRDYRKDQATRGTLLDGDVKLCVTLENRDLNNAPDVSCIPEGTYEIVNDTTGTFQYWKILGVPNRFNCEIHGGNIEADTRGCILFGESWVTMNGELAINNSLATLKKMKEVLPDEFLLEITT